LCPQQLSPVRGGTCVNVGIVDVEWRLSRVGSRIVALLTLCLVVCSLHNTVVKLSGCTFGPNQMLVQQEQTE
jgi:hypothetical protein